MPDVEKTEAELAAEAAELAVVAEAEKAEQAYAEAEAELSAGFTGAETKPTEETPLVETTPVAEVVPEPVVPEPVVPEPVFAKITDVQFQDVLAKANSVEEVRAAFAKYQRDAGGRIGGLEETIKQIKAATQSGQALEVSEADLEEVSKEYPDLAKALAKDFVKVFGKAKPPVAVATVEPVVDLETKIAPLVEERVAKAAQTAAENRAAEIAQEIAETHADWRTITGPRDSVTPYRTWLKAQGAEQEFLVLNSKSPSTIIKSIDKFKAFEAEKAKKPPKVVDGKNARSERLVEAIPAKGGGGSPPIPKTKTPDEELAEGFANK